MPGQERGRDGGSPGWDARKSVLGHYIPNAEPRPIPLDAFVRESVVRRMRAVSDYQPANLPTRYQVVSMPSGPADQVS
jgi:hypothetical protein